MSPRKAAAVDAASIVPDLGPAPKLRRPRTLERTLPNGLRVVAVRQPGVPLVEFRLRTPIAAVRRGTELTYPARAALLADSLLTGTQSHSQTELAEALQAVGSDVSVSADADRLLISGSALAPGLPTLLGLLADVLTGAAYPNREVGVERERLVERLTVARSQPSVLAREALAQRMFGDHPYARELARPEVVSDVQAAQLRRLHRDRLVPTGSVLVLVGDISPARAVSQVERALSGWGDAAAPAAAAEAPPLPAITSGPPLIVHRPGSVQSAIRLGAPALPRSDPDYPAYQLANLVFGGYFSSRLTENIREDKGYTYTPASRIDHAPAGSTLIVQADVATEVTAPALLEIGYELGRIATTPVKSEELEAVRQYAIGTLSLSIATQAGLASTLAAFAGVGLGVDWLVEHTARLAKVTLDEVCAQAERLLAPSGAVTVVLGDADQISEPVRRLGPIEIGSLAGAGG
jgi:predicted Zn-dependent peptidase